MCDRNIHIDESNNYSFWENHSTSRDEKEIIYYLKNNLYLITNKKILHIGIGNSEFGNSFKQYAEIIDGITISGLEKNKALKNNCYSNIYICNKYNVKDMSINILNYYDLIIDQGIKQYTCCQLHFEELFNFYIKRLNKNGMIVTSKLGMDWSGYDIQSKILYNQINNYKHDDITNIHANKVLSISELNNLANKYNFAIKTIENTKIIVLHI